MSVIRYLWNLCGKMISEKMFWVTKAEVLRISESFLENKGEEDGKEQYYEIDFPKLNSTRQIVFRAKLQKA